jgi:hypothetical protein
MTVEWPAYKRLELALLIDNLVVMPQPYLSLTAAASILGKIRLTAALSDWRAYLSVSLRSALSRAARAAALSSGSVARWWQRSRIWVSRATVKDLNPYYLSLAPRPRQKHLSGAAPSGSLLPARLAPSIYQMLVRPGLVDGLRQPSFCGGSCVTTSLSLVSI